jgi:hypothetical protein
MLMVRRLLLLCLLALSAVAPGVHAQTAPAGTAAPAANAVDPAAIQALKDMGAYLQTLKRFHVSTQVTGERVLADGQKLQRMATAEVDAERPNRLRIAMQSARLQRVLYYDGKTFTLHQPSQKVYSSVEFEDDIPGLVGRLQKYGVEMPLTDLFVWGTPAAPIDRIESAMNAGPDFVDDDLCEHYAFRQGKFDWQIWVVAGNKPLPRKMVITRRDDDARPQSVHLIDWNLKPVFKSTTFRFTAPKGVTRVEMVAPKAK